MINKNLIIFICFLILTLIITFFYHFIFKNESFGYPYYPTIYQSVPEYVYSNDPNIRLMGSGDLLVWNSDPIHPLLVKCRDDNFQSDICKYIIGSQKIVPTTP